MYGTAKSKVGKTPSKKNFTVGQVGGKDALGGNIHKGKDLRGLAGKNQGKMPKSMT